MRHQRWNIALVLAAALAAASCAGTREYQLTSSGDIPAAASNVKIDTNDNGNTSFAITVEHLALPEKVASGANVYVVWVRGLESSARIQNMGAMQVDDDLNGSFSGVTPLREFEIFVTAESTYANTEPTGKALLYTTVTPK